MIITLYIWLFVFFSWFVVVYFEQTCCHRQTQLITDAQSHNTTVVK